MKTFLGAVATALALLLVFILVRGFMHQPSAMTPVPRVDLPLDADAVAAHLEAAVQFRTVSHESEADFEADQFQGFIDWVAETYPTITASMERTLLGGYTMLYRWQGSDAALLPILITAHYDVVPVVPGTESAWQFPPFAGEIADGVIWGRGTLDDKSAVIAQLEAANLLLQSGFKPARTVYFSFGHDEEVGGTRGAATVVAHLAEQNVRLAWSLDEGSFLFKGLLPGVEPLMAAINVAEKGGLTLDIVAKAAGGHSSMPPRQTAVGILAEAITRLEASPVPGGLSGLSEQMFDTASRHMPFGYRVLFANRWLFGGVLDDQLSSTTFGNAMLRTTTAPTMLSGSPKVNVLPIEAVATVNFRLHPRDTVDDVVNHVRAVVENESVEVRVREGGGRPASEVSDWRSPGFDVIARSVREIYGEVVITPGLMIAGSDSRHYARVADNAFRFNPMTVTQDDLTGFHGTNESISVENLAQGTRTYVQIIRHAAGP